MIRHRMNSYLLSTSSAWAQAICAVSLLIQIFLCLFLIFAYSVKIPTADFVLVVPFVLLF